MDKPLIITEEEKKKCAEALAELIQGVDAKTVESKYPDCREIIAKWLINQNTEGE